MNGDGAELYLEAAVGSRRRSRVRGAVVDSAGDVGRAPSRRNCTDGYGVPKDLAMSSEGAK